MTKQRQKGPRQKGWWIPWTFVGFFGVVLLANGIMAAVAFSTWTGLKTSSAYQDGLAYNETLAKRTIQADLGWRVAVAVEQPSEGRARIAVEISDRDGQPILADRVRALLVRPTHSGFDQEAALEIAGEGRYEAQLALLLAGQWDVRLTVSRGRDIFETHRRIMVGP